MGARRWGGPVTPRVSPWTFYADRGPDAAVWLSATVTFNAANTLTGGNVFRDPSCPYTKVILGALNPDGSPAAGARTIAVPAGTTVFTAAQLAAVGLQTVSDIVNAPQITAVR